MGFYLGFVVDYFLLGFVFVAVALLLWFYSEKYQKTILLGNIFISLLSAFAVFIVWLFELFALRADPVIYAEAMKQINVITIIVIGYTVFAFLVSLIREIFKDIEDIEGDREAGYHTLPIGSGIRRANWLAIGLIFITIAVLAVAQYYLYKKGITLVFWYLMIAVQLLFMFLLYNAVKAKSKEDFRFLSNACKIIMVAGILSMQLFYVSF
jgi:4-hydroxybenzoate polyprenyltransferase